MSDQAEVLQAELERLRNLKGSDLFKFKDLWDQGAWDFLGGLLF